MDVPGMLLEVLSLRSIQFDKQKIEEITNGRLSRLLKAAARTPYFSSALGDAGPCEVFDSLPALERKTVQSSPESFIPSGASIASLSKFRTSGSGGMPLTVYSDRRSVNHRIAVRHFIESESGLSPRDKYLEITYRDFGTVPFLKHLGLYRRKCVSVLGSPDAIFASLMDFRPSVIGQYPSAMLLMAKTNNSRSRPLRLKSVFCAAENLEDQCRSIISDSFSCPVFNFYGATECGYAAFECSEGKMHAITTSNLVEIIGEDGRPSRSATGRIAVTPLDNHGMCLLRYALDDTARWGRDCPCGRGFPVLVGLRGKPGRLIRLPSGRSVSATAFMMMHLLEGILEYQIIQEKTDRFSFLYVPAAAELPPETRRKAEKMIREACLNEKICLSLEKTGKIPKGKTGKHEAVLSLVDE